MRYQVRLTHKAERDVDEVLGWFRQQQAPSAATRWFNRLMAAIGTLERLPTRCGLAAEAEEIGRDIRELHVGRRQGSYRVLFEIYGRNVIILRVWHAARDRLTPDDL